MKRVLAIAVAAAAGCAGQSQSDADAQAIADARRQMTFHQRAQVTIAQPAPGSFIPTAADGLVDVSGSAHGSAVIVNGQSVSTDAAGNFHARIPATMGINVVNVHLGSLWGGEAQRAFVYGDFADPATAIASGVMLRATAAAYGDADSDLDDFSRIGTALLGQADMLALVRQLPPYSYSFPGGSVDVSVANVQFANDQTALALTPRAVGAHVNGSLANVVVTLHFVLHLSGDHATDGTVSVDTVGFDSDINADYSATAQIPNPAGGFTTGPGIEGSMAAPTIRLGKLTVATTLNFDGIDDFLTFLANQFKGLIEQTVAQQIQSSAANHYAMTLNQFGLPPTFDLRPYGIDASLKASESFDGAAFDDQGVTLSAATNFAWPSLAPGAPGAAAPGSLVTHSAPAGAFPAATMGVSVAFDALNQATFAAWGQDGLRREVYPAKNFVVFKLDPVVAAPLLPPVILPGAGGRLQVSLGDVVVTTQLHTFFFDGPVQATLSAVADVSLDIDPANGALRMTMTGKPSIQLDINSVLGIIPDALLAPLSSALQSIAPSIVEKLVKPIEVPLPKMKLGKLIAGSTASIGLASPVNVAVGGGRVMVSGDLAQ